MTWPINYYDEPRILVPHEQIDDPSDKFSYSQLEYSRRNVSEILSKACDASSRPGVAGSPHLHLVTNITTERDICSHAELATQHGFFTSPTTLIVVPDRLPMFSASKLSTFSDILLPSFYYLAQASSYDPSQDVPWEDKANTMYWRGSTTGGYARNGDWKSFHRQRFMSFVGKEEERMVPIMRRTARGLWVPVSAKMGSMSSLFDARFIDVIQCDLEECQDEMDLFGVVDRDPAAAGFKNRFIFDLDGNAFSGRFYRLLASKSTVVKQGIFQEWHDDWLVPWLHYIPVSMELDDLPEVIRYLSTVGGEQARIVAEAGQVAAKTMLRGADMSAYIARVVLEMARLVADDRDDWSTDCPP